MRARATLILCAAWIAASSWTQAADAGDSPDRVDFRADRATLDPDRGTVELTGQVRATCGRYRLAADRLRIDASAEQVEVTGPASVVLCPCADAPVSVGFESATIRPPSDLVLKSPRLKLGDTTVLVLPAAWLRGPDQVGLLPPRIAWRGADGLLLGPGFHLPWPEDPAGLASLDVYLSGYVKGGAELTADLRTSRTSSRLRLDRMHGDLAEVLSSGAAGQGAGVVSWSANLARGDRATRGLIELESAARRYDELRAQVAARPFGSLALATGVEVWAARPSQGALAFGPMASASAGGSIATIGAWDIGLSTRVLSEPGGSATQLSRAAAGAELDATAGPVALSWMTRSSAAALVVDDRDVSDLAALTGVRGALPLSRRYGPSEHSPVHAIEPFVQATATAARSSWAAWLAADRVPALAMGQHWISSGGFRTTLGPAGGAAWLDAEIAAGAVGQWQQRAPAPAVLGQLTLDTHVLGLKSQGAGLRENQRMQGVILARARIGAARSVHLAPRIAHRGDLDPMTARALTSADPYAIGGTWLDRAGTSVGADAVVPVGRGYRLFGGADADATDRTWLGSRGGVMYEHPCGCLAATAWVGQRLGREGVDGWLALDLAPR
ncbi:MAG: hypothetical protein HY898_11055 [Deltaproteobacteria bacterium]|nr:hypothetical protein [Deltaproteobacteria bacterium]